MRTIAIAGAGAEGLSASLPAAVHALLDLSFVVPSGTTVADVVSETVSAIGDQRVLLFGHSMNGTLALAVAADAGPERVAGTIAVGAPPALPPDVDAMRQHWLAHAEPERRARFDACAERAAAATDPGERARWIDAADATRRWHDLDFDPTPIDSRYERPKDEALVWASAVMADAAGLDWGRVRAAQPAPVLLCLGRSDHLIPHTSWDGVEPRPPQLDTELFERSGHTPFVEEPERFTDVLARWLSDR